MTKDLPDFLSEVVSAAVEASSFRGGPFAARPVAPVARDIYFATDTKVLYVCVTDGAWTGFDAAILVQGALTLYANLAGNGKRITNIADPTAAQDAATRAYVLAQLAGFLTVAHETATTGIHGVGASTIDSVALRDAAVAAEATARAAADALRLLLAGGTMTGPIAMGNNKITGLAAPTAAADAARKAEVDAVDAKLDDVSHAEPTRALGTNYHNNSGKIRLVTVTVKVETGGGNYFEASAYIGSSSPASTLIGAFSGSYDPEVTSNAITFIVPPGYYYKVTEVGQGLKSEWHEWDFH
ncbi:hypothetical protein ES703_29488 [subsurface metagenome]